MKLATSAGDIVVELDAAKAPKTVDNFVQYVKAGHYDGTVFHRVINNFMIQGGGMTADLKEKPTRAPIALESRNGLTNERGTRRDGAHQRPELGDRAVLHQRQGQRLPEPPQARDGNGYAVFGKVISGMDVVDKIRAVPTGPERRAGRRP